ncbi:MAG: hypothetical protein HY929_04770 [Euryarchaeota archaeon]|nr:hypothetical protein [Euryarchaeota archaeon]
MEINWKKGIIAGIAAGVVFLVVGMVSGFIFSPEYAATPQLWKPMTGAWWYQIIALNFLEGILYGLIFSVLYNGIPGKGWKRGLNFGLILWLVATVPGMSMTYLTMAVPNTIVLSWTIGGLISLVIAGPVITVVYEKIK